MCTLLFTCGGISFDDGQTLINRNDDTFCVYLLSHIATVKNGILYT